MLTFLLSGLWHGSNVTFLVWGILHGFGVFISSGPKKNRLKHSIHIQIFYWFLTYIFINLSWIVFRANTLSDAWYIYKTLGISAFYGLFHISFIPLHAIDQLFVVGIYQLQLTRSDILILFGAISLLFGMEYISRHVPFFKLKGMWFIMSIVLLLSLINFASIHEAPFVYFQF